MTGSPEEHSLFFIISFNGWLVRTNSPCIYLNFCYFTFNLEGQFSLSKEFSDCNYFLQWIKDAIPLSSGKHGVYWATGIYGVDIFHQIRGMLSPSLSLPALLFPSGIPFKYMLNSFPVSFLSLFLLYLVHLPIH